MRIRIDPPCIGSLGLPWQSTTDWLIFNNRYLQTDNSGGWKFKIKVLAKLFFTERGEEESVPCPSLKFWWFARNQRCGCITPHCCLHVVDSASLHITFSLGMSTLLFFFLIRTLVMLELPLMTSFQLEYLCQDSTSR